MIKTYIGYLQIYYAKTLTELLYFSRNLSIQLCENRCDLIDFVTEHIGILTQNSLD